MAVALNLSWITEELAIGGRFEQRQVAELVRVHRVGAVVDLRAEACDDEVLLGRHGLAFLSLPTLDHGATEPRMLRAGVAFVLEHLRARRRVLVHCEHGIGRSALLGLCVLVERGLSPLTALALAKERRALVSPSQAQYEAWCSWLRAAGMTPPAFDDFAAIVYRHVGGR